MSPLSLKSVWTVSLCASAALLAGCTPAPSALPAPPPPEVTVVEVSRRDVPVVFEYPAQAESPRQVEIRARVDGYLQKRLYEEGTIVQAGAPLFQIDPSFQHAALLSARAQVQQAESRLQNSQQTMARMKSLLADEAVSPKDMDDAMTVQTSAAASLESARSELARAEMQMGFTRLAAPFSGLSGKSVVAEGSYVNPMQNGLLTTIAQLDPIHVSFNLSQNEWLTFADEVRKGTLRFPANGADFDVRLVMPDGTLLPAHGRLRFSSQTVDPQTGSYMIHAAFPNPDLLLRPGQYLRVQLLGTVRPAALLVPQRAVMQGQRGKFVYVVGDGQKAEMRPVEVGEWIEDQWLIQSGLKGGERVVVDGTLKVQPGAPVKPVPARASGVVAAPATAPASSSGNGR